MFSLFSKPPYKIGLALSGGGARGFAHAGALLAFERMGIKPDIVAGVSAGSIVAVFYAAGISPERMLQLFRDAKFTDFAELSVPKNGFFRLDKFKSFIRKNVPYENIEDLPVKVVIGATDFDHGEKVLFETGSLAERVAASCCIPIVFNPIKINGTRYVDGGVLHNLPAWAIRDRCKYLIGINCSPLINWRIRNNLMDTALRSYELMAKNNARSDMELCDLVVRTNSIAKYRVFNLKEIEKVFRSGYDETMKVLLDNGFKDPEIKT